MGDELFTQAMEFLKLLGCDNLEGPRMYAKAKRMSKEQLDAWKETFELAKLDHGLNDPVRFVRGKVLYYDHPDDTYIAFRQPKLTPREQFARNLVDFWSCFRNSKGLIGLWMSESGKYPEGIALEALQELKRDEESNRSPTLKLFHEKAAALNGSLKRYLAAKQDTSGGIPISAQEMANLDPDGWWAAKEALPRPDGPRYKELRDKLQHGKVEEVIGPEVVFKRIPDRPWEDQGCSDTPEEIDECEPAECPDSSGSRQEGSDSMGMPSRDLDMAREDDARQ